MNIIFYFLIDFLCVYVSFSLLGPYISNLFTDSLWISIYPEYIMFFHSPTWTFSPCIRIVLLICFPIVANYFPRKIQIPWSDCPSNIAYVDINVLSMISADFATGKCGRQNSCTCFNSSTWSNTLLAYKIRLYVFHNVQEIIFLAYQN